VHCVTIIDGVTNQVITTLQVGVTPSSLAYNSINNKIYCSSWANGRIHIIDGATNQLIDSIIYGNSGPKSLFYFYYYNYKIFYANFTGDNIKVIDGMTDTIIATLQLPVGTRPYALGFNNYYLLCASIGSNNITVINVMDYPYIIVSTINNIEFPIALVTASYWRTYVASLLSASVYVIRPWNAIEEYSNSKIESPRTEIFPNPAKSYFTIYSPQLATRSTLKIFDINGKLIKDVKVTKQNMTISLKGIKPGVYFINMDANVKKLVVTR